MIHQTYHTKTDQKNNDYLEKFHIKASYSGADSFRSNIRSAIRGLWGGSTDLLNFVNMMSLAIQRGYTAAWEDGMRSSGLEFSDITQEERDRLALEIGSQNHYLVGFGMAIEDQSKAKKGALGPLFERGELWVGRYSAVRGIAMSMANTDKKLKWVMDVTKEHCPSCLRLNGRIYRNSIWKKYNIYPRMNRLACRGYRCGCRFEITTDKVTPGRPPQV